MMMANSYALISSKSNFVENTIVADSDFEIEGYYLVEISQETPASTGMVYDTVTKSFSWP